MLNRIHGFVKRPLYHVLTVALFLLITGVGYKMSGIAFVAEWAGGVAAAISIFALIFKTQGYWIWSIVNAILWFYLFGFEYDTKILAGLQVGYMVFCTYGFIMWSVVRNRIGYSPAFPKDNIGSILASAIFIYTLYAYRGMEGYTYTTWWWVEVTAVAISIASNWMDAFKYKGNWIGWTMTNILFAPLFWHLGLMGPFILTFLYQVFCIIGFYRWYKEEKKLIAQGEVVLVGGAKYA